MKVKITQVHEKTLTREELRTAAIEYINIEYPNNTYEENGFLVMWTNTHGSGIIDKIRPITSRDKAYLLIRAELIELNKKDKV